MSDGLMEGPTARELEVLNLLIRGCCNKEIACCLKISENTVEFHLKNIFRKLEALNRSQALLKAIKAGWIAAE